MCVKLENNGKIIIPRTYVPIKIESQIIRLFWGIDLGHGLVNNARIESILGNVWTKHGMSLNGLLQADAFWEGNNRLKFNKMRDIAVIHNMSQFVLVTEPALPWVKVVHHRQPCYTRIKELTLQAA